MEGNFKKFRWYYRKGFIMINFILDKLSKDEKNTFRYGLWVGMMVGAFLIFIVYGISHYLR